MNDGREVMQWRRTAEIDVSRTADAEKGEQRLLAKSGSGDCRSGSGTSGRAGVRLAPILTVCRI